MVVPVLMTSGQGSENLNNGPLAAQITMVMTASANTQGRPTARAVTWARSEKSRLVDRDSPASVAPGDDTFVVPAIFRLRIACTRCSFAAKQMFQKGNSSGSPCAIYNRSDWLPPTHSTFLLPLL